MGHNKAGENRKKRLRRRKKEERQLEEIARRKLPPCTAELSEIMVNQLQTCPPPPANNEDLPDLVMRETVHGKTIWIKNPKKKFPEDDIVYDTLQLTD